MQKFCEAFYGDRKIKQDTFLESCGLADLVTTRFLTLHPKTLTLPLTLNPHTNPNPKP